MGGEHRTVVFVVTSGLTSAWRQLTSGLKSSDETDEASGSITRLWFVWFTSNFVHLPPHKSRIQLSSNFLSENFIWRKVWRDPAAMMHNKGLQEDDIQKLHTTIKTRLIDERSLRMWWVRKRRKWNWSRSVWHVELLKMKKRGQFPDESVVEWELLMEQTELTSFFHLKNLYVSVCVMKD
jgi:hypothetical protein